MWMYVLFANLNYHERYKIINTLARICDPDLRLGSQ